ncbi:uncharacterized protein LOC101862183 [Aplysia californica]|uniref:Uncharacterized protein LOC101862183 n=1 Tax=Aplysia californica TaxID=6500 RepID=A0ABM0ZZW2_APLCA|nr:uncharacterized protein LOC101862183 [Aplysia californica]XP_012937963.1 uncharacterized protein LOC101862183 [Aplysia californica]
MLTSMYPSASTSSPFQERMLMFHGKQLEVKQERLESMDDVPLSEAPVDMTVSGKDSSPSPALSRQYTAADKEQVFLDAKHRFRPYPMPHPHHNLNHSFMLPKYARDGASSPDDSVVNQSEFLNVVAPIRPEVGSFQMKGSDGKLTMPSILVNNVASPAYRNELMPMNTHQRAKREFVPDNKKDEGYWNKRLKNNDSARRSRVKRKALEKMMETRMLDLQKENIELKHEMRALKRRFGLDENATLSDDGSSEMPGRPVASFTALSRPSSSSPSPEKLHPNDDLDQQRPGSDDSRSNDDSRMYNVNTLNHMLGPATRDRTDSIGSSTSSMGSSASGAGHSAVALSLNSKRNLLSSRAGSHSPHSPSPLPHRVDLTAIRTDKSGALDLTSEHSNRSTPARDSSSPESCTSAPEGNNSAVCAAANRRYSLLSTDGSSHEDGNSSSSSSSSSVVKDFKSYPFKCRLKKELKSAHDVSSPLAEDSSARH